MSPLSSSPLTSPHRPPSPTSCPPSRRAPNRRGFSLVELLVVIAIIGVLMGLLLAAIGPIRNTVRTAEVSVELQGLAQGITEFKAEYGMEPPSGITIHEAAADWTADTQSSVLVQRMWPQYNFSDFDIDGDGNETDSFVMTGDECLLFFLGGVDTITDESDPTDEPVANGFSANPTNPFASGGNRVGPFGDEFDPDRMFDADGDGAHAYADAFPSSTVAYLYLSSYGGQSYRPLTDADFDNDGVPELFTSVDTDGNGTQDEVAYSVYMQQDPDSTTPNDTPTAREAGEVPWKKDSYQIISAGQDGLYGCGGIWTEEGGLSHNLGAGEEVLNISDARDNVTNFSGGTME